MFSNLLITILLFVWAIAGLIFSAVLSNRGKKKFKTVWHKVAFHIVSGPVLWAMGMFEALCKTYDYVRTNYSEVLSDFVDRTGKFFFK